MTTQIFKPAAVSKQQDANIVKIAVEMENKQPQLYAFNQRLPLATIIQDICSGWSLSDSEQYALQFSETNNKNYIIEKNRNEIKNGSVLLLSFSAFKTADNILMKLSDKGSTVQEKTSAMKKLSLLCGDVTFAYEFIRKEGLFLITKFIQERKCKGLMLAYCLMSFVELMEHGIVSWNNLEPVFISTVGDYVNDPKKVSEKEMIVEKDKDKKRDKDFHVETEIVKASLSILESIALYSEKFSLVESHVTLAKLVTHLKNQNSIIQQNAIALINALFSKADFEKRKELAATACFKEVRNAIHSIVVQSPGEKVGTEMAHQLYVLQTFILGLLEQRMNSKLDPQDQDAHDKIKELRKVAFESDNLGFVDASSKRQTGAYAKDYKKLGFRTDINPAQDFTEAPPGMLALDCMIYFARAHPESYTKVVLENSCRADEHECPFGRTSVELVKLLCEILRIGDIPSEQGVHYHPMFFTHDHPFEEFYHICIVLLNKTWKEMRATIEDYTKVFSVVREQITRALAPQPITLEKFRNHILRLTYSEITNLWQQERTSREEWESHAKPIVELKELITPEIVDLIQEQRLTYLVEGGRFTKYSSRGQRVKDKFWYIRLSSNYKVFQYGDCDEKSIPELDQLPNKIPVSEIKALLVGKDCPHMKEVKNRKSTHHLAFSLTLDSAETTSLDFVAPDEEIFDYWTDGINALLGNKMTSKEAEEDLQTLLSMEIKIRLLDAEGVEIPHEPPEIPEDPPNYDFHC